MFLLFFNRFCYRRPAHAQIPAPGENTRTYSNQGFTQETESTSVADEGENNPGTEPEYEIPDIIPKEKNPGDGWKNKNYQSLGNRVERRPHTYASLNIGFTAESKV